MGLEFRGLKKTLGVIGLALATGAHDVQAEIIRQKSVPQGVESVANPDYVAKSLKRQRSAEEAADKKYNDEKLAEKIVETFKKNLDWHVLRQQRLYELEHEDPTYLQRLEQGDVMHLHGDPIQVKLAQGIIEGIHHSMIYAKEPIALERGKYVAYYGTTMLKLMDEINIEFARFHNAVQGSDLLIDAAYAGAFPRTP